MTTCRVNFVVFGVLFFCGSRSNDVSPDVTHERDRPTVLSTLGVRVTQGENWSAVYIPSIYKVLRTVLVVLRIMALCS